MRRLFGPMFLMWVGFPQHMSVDLAGSFACNMYEMRAVYDRSWRRDDVVDTSSDVYTC